MRQKLGFGLWARLRHDVTAGLGATCKLRALAIQMTSYAAWIAYTVNAESCWRMPESYAFGVSVKSRQTRILRVRHATFVSGPRR